MRIFIMPHRSYRRLGASVSGVIFRGKLMGGQNDGGVETKARQRAMTGEGSDVAAMILTMTID